MGIELTKTLIIKDNLTGRDFIIYGHLISLAKERDDVKQFLGGILESNDPVRSAAVLEYLAAEDDLLFEEIVKRCTKKDDKLSNDISRYREIIRKNPQEFLQLYLHVIEKTLSKETFILRLYPFMKTMVLDDFLRLLKTRDFYI